MKGEGEQMREFYFGVGVREWMVKTLSPFHAITRVRKNDARWREIHAQRRRNDADMREAKKPTDGELFNADK